MKKILYTILVCLIFQLSASAVEEVSLEKMPKEQVQISKSPKVIKGSMLISNDSMLDELISLQKQKDLEDIDMLWKGTVENNKVIGFALKKLATPESQRRIHSSLMAKTLSAVISGSSLVPSVIGADPTIRTSAFAVGRIAQALINKKTTPQEIPLTDTEMIELAGLVEDLQDEIISIYYNYKNALNQVKDTRAKLILYNKNYNNAIKSGDILDIAVSASLYDNMILEEYHYLQLATKYHQELQRLAGKRTVDKLNLYQYNFNSALFKTNSDTTKTKTKTKAQNIVVPQIRPKENTKSNDSQGKFFLHHRTNNSTTSKISPMPVPNKKQFEKAEKNADLQTKTDSANEKYIFFNKKLKTPIQNEKKDKTENIKRQNTSVSTGGSK